MAMPTASHVPTVVVFDFMVVHTDPFGTHIELTEGLDGW